MTATPTRIAPYEVQLGAHSVWLQGNLAAGNANPGFSKDWETNRQAGLAVLSQFSVAETVIQMRPPDAGFGWVDLDKVSAPPQEMLRTEGMITSDPDHILHANPADCGELAIEGRGSDGRPFIALQHVGIRVVRAAAHLDMLEYLCESRGIDPKDLSVRLGPSVRAPSYAFETIEEELASDPRWSSFVYKDDHGLWHKDVHGVTVNDLIQFGVAADKIVEHPDDTAAEGSRYFSYTREKQGNWPVGCNALYFAMSSQ